MRSTAHGLYANIVVQSSREKFESPLLIFEECHFQAFGLDMKNAVTQTLAGAWGTVAVATLIKEPPHQQTIATQHKNVAKKTNNHGILEYDVYHPPAQGSQEHPGPSSRAPQDRQHRYQRGRSRLGRAREPARLNTTHHGRSAGWVAGLQVGLSFTAIGLVLLLQHELHGRLSAQSDGTQ